MITFDLKQDLKTLYRASAKQPEVLTVPPLPFLMIDGTGDPNGQAFAEAVSALYSTAYTLKFALKKQGIVYPVMPSEGLWWADDMGDFLASNRANWRWTMMIVQPEAITEADVTQTIIDLKRKKNLPALEQLRLARYDEGLAAQILHVGSYAAEAPTIIRLHQFIEAQGYTRSGKHHEIYLSDPQRTAPEKLKTIIRQPIQPKS